MAMYYVYKKEWDSYFEHRGVLVVASSSNRAKGIGMKSLDCANYPNKNILVREIEPVEEGLICKTDSILL